MSNILRIIKISKPLHKTAYILAFLILVGALIGLVSPLLNKSIIDQITQNVSGKSGNLNFLYILIAINFGVSVLDVLIGAISERLGDHFAGKLNQFLTEKFYRKVLSLPQKYFDGELSGKIVHQLNRGIVSIKDFANVVTNFFLPTILQTIFTIVVLAYYNLPTAILFIILFPIYTYLSIYSSKKWGEKEVFKNKLEDKNRGRITEVIGNIKIVKGFTNEINELKFIINNLFETNKIYGKQSQTFHIFDFLRNLSLHIILLFINLIIFKKAFDGSMTIGTMALILQLLLQARRPLFAMSFILSRLASAESGSKEFFEILNLPSKEDFETKDSSKLKNINIEFKDVFFNYEKSANVLNGINFVMNKNEKTALVGPSGVGKSTIISLILKFYNPTKGKILMSGKDYKDLSHKFIRNNIALVFQENELFSTTIEENVAYGVKASEVEIIEALKQANAWDFVNKLKKGLKSEVGERGVRLSGGQKQRIQIARAILSNRPILILDEATSSLDSESEKLVHEALNNLMKNKLVIIIAHRFSTIQNVDKILVIEDGKIADSGTPRELAKRPGLYNKLLKYQIEGDKKLLENFELY